MPDTPAQAFVTRCQFYVGLMVVWAFIGLELGGSPRLDGRASATLMPSGAFVLMALSC